MASSGKSLRAFRRWLGFTADELAESLGVDRTTVTRWERETVTVPDWIADILLFAPKRNRVDGDEAGANIYRRMRRYEDEPESTLHPRYLVMVTMLRGRALDWEEAMLVMADAEEWTEMEE